MKSLKFKLLGFILLVFCITTFSQSKPAQNNTPTTGVVETVKSAIPDSASVTMSTMYNDVKGAIIGLSKALKVGAEHVYEVLVRQQIVKSVIWLLLLFISFYLLFNFAKRAKDPEEQWIKNPGTSNSGPAPIGIIRIFQVIGGTIMFAISIAHIDVILTGFINPEYGAISEIMEMVSSK